MKLASFAVETPVGRQVRVGAADGDDIVDVTTAYADLLDRTGEADPLAIARVHAPPSMQELLARGDRGMAAARDGLAHARERGDERGPNGGRLRFGREEIELLAPLPRPNSLRDFMAFEEHVKNTMGEPPDVWYDQPIYYKSNPDTVVGTGVDIEWPAYSDKRDYELEIAAIIGREGENIDAEDAEEYIAGYTIFNDFSARDTQLSEMQGRLGPAKGKDFANALGPFLVTTDVFDPTQAAMIAEVNGETYSEGTPGDMYHSFSEIIEHVSQSEPLKPGDVLGSGTVGEGCGLELGRFLDPDDTVRLTVEGIGTLENTIV